MSELLFSIVIPTYRRAPLLARCLDAVAGLEYPADRFETIVVDDGSGANLDELIGPWRDRLRLTALSSVHAGPSVARNVGAAHAQGEYLVFIDDDCRPDPGWLTALERRVRVHPHCMIGGGLVNRRVEDPFAIASDLLIRHLFRRWNADPDHAQFLVSANLVVRADHFREIGGFHAAFGAPGAEDRALCARWIASGRQIVFAPEAVVYHEHPMSLAGFSRQHFNYGRGASTLHKLGTSGLPNGGRVEGLSWYLDLFAMPLAEGYRLRAPHLTSLLLLAQMASVAGFLSDWLGGLPEPESSGAQATENRAIG